MNDIQHPSMARALLIVLVTVSGLAVAIMYSRNPPLPVTVDTAAKMSVADVRAAIEQAALRREAALNSDSALSQSLWVEQWGVEVIGVKRALAGYMLDFRFRVLDLDKALPLFDPRKEAYLLTDRTRIKLPVPMAEKIGAFRPTNRGQNIKTGKTYYILFANPDSHVKPNETVSVIIGDFKAEHLTVS